MNGTLICRLACAVCGLLVQSSPAWPQTTPSSHGRRSVFVADVFASADSTPLADADVLIPALSREARTDFSGEANIGEVPSGAFRVVVRKVGYVSADLTIKFARDTVRVDFVLGAGIRALDTVRTTAEKTRDEHLRGFQIRQAMGIGRFVNDSVLFGEPTRPVADIIASHLPGIAVVDNGRTVARRMCVSPTGAPLENASMVVYVDGVRMGSRGAPDATDLRALSGRDVAGI
ncbi:MAG TPA: hypothetical protein VH277_14200, partial [Gemmatimonadaceae bacterium]|nr:hypothetical protein [Gemmatimonadaceae bacterium]